MRRHRGTFQYTFRLYLNADGKRVLGKGGAQILEAIDKYGSIDGAAKKLQMSYKFVWDYLTRMRRILKEQIILTHRGGTGPRKKRGGGGATLTPVARKLLKEYRSTQALVHRALRTRGRSIILRQDALRSKSNVKRKT
jgi:molybdate transport system regulatory protein